VLPLGRGAVGVVSNSSAPPAGCRLLVKQEAFAWSNGQFSRATAPSCESYKQGGNLWACASCAWPAPLARLRKREAAKCGDLCAEARGVGCGGCESASSRGSGCVATRLPPFFTEVAWQVTLFPSQKGRCGDARVCPLKLANCLNRCLHKN